MEGLVSVILEPQVLNLEESDHKFCWSPTLSTSVSEGPFRIG